VVGVDLLPSTPPRGVSTFQGDFRSPIVQAIVRKYLLDPDRGRPRIPLLLQEDGGVEGNVMELDQGYIDRERMTEWGDSVVGGGLAGSEANSTKKPVDVVLSDMWEPWPKLPTGKRSIDLPYDRLMNTSGIKRKDHFGSMVGLQLSPPPPPTLFPPPRLS
jgi:21S rRNA (uridine2791-2'-O)-methyltransferase